MIDSLVMMIDNVDNDFSIFFQFIFVVLVTSIYFIKSLTSLLQICQIATKTLIYGNENRIFLIAVQKNSLYYIINYLPFTYSGLSRFA